MLVFLWTLGMRRTLLNTASNMKKQNPSSMALVALFRVRSSRRNTWCAESLIPTVIYK